MVEYLMLFIGVPYVWGGNGPVQGFDCSGLICEGLKSVGKIDTDEDFTAQGLFDRCMGWNSFNVRQPGKGDLVFFGKSNASITHVGIMIDDTTMLEAGGGSRTITSINRAKAANAFVRLRPYKYRSDLLSIVRVPGSAAW